MIIVTVEYDSTATVDSRSLNPLYTRDTLLALRDSIEPMVGKLFAENLNCVEVRIRPFEQFDEFDESILFTIDVIEKNPSLQSSYFARNSGEDFQTTIEEYLAQFIHEDITSKTIVKLHVGFVFPNYPID